MEPEGYGREQPAWSGYLQLSTIQLQRNLGHNLQQTESKTDKDGHFLFPLKLDIGYDEKNSSEHCQLCDNVKNGYFFPSSTFPGTLFADEIQR